MLKTSLFWFVAHLSHNAEKHNGNPDFLKKRAAQQRFRKATTVGLTPALAFSLRADPASAGRCSASKGQPRVLLLTSSSSQNTWLNLVRKT